ncbi:pyridoxamine 5'-phosphate oxidase family protein [Tumidithrix elongata RA019]|uniref:Pyridoxamine 5'-phosphate oxidase family protein n=1 Tax=Tumidithrix elongata BACA0141 TaxID=2716417 RepID=A0AAW9PNZ9_9CYAN|nr:pyridoxamine 5'-phosphate oxidase family protein [Tumidithrix elongata RA019]
MAKFYPSLTKELREFIEQQHIYFVASAPNQGRVNLSPKGMDSLRCLSDSALAYLDLTGSGNETAAHVLENGRITIMVCSFTEKPLILRAYGQGKPIRPRDTEWQELSPLFPAIAGTRQIMHITVESVQTSCGFAVPFFEFQGERKVLKEWAEKKGEEGVREYWEKNNQESIDGIPTYLLG